MVCVINRELINAKQHKFSIIFHFPLPLSHLCYLGNCDPCRIHRWMPFIKIETK